MRYRVTDYQPTIRHLAASKFMIFPVTWIDLARRAIQTDQIVDLVDPIPKFHNRTLGFCLDIVYIFLELFAHLFGDKDNKLLVCFGRSEQSK